MRIGCLVISVSAVALSGCSWLGGGFGNSAQGVNGQFNKGGRYAAQTSRQGFGAQSRINPSYTNPCQIFTPTQPIPRGCDPANVTLATGGDGFPQSPNFSGGEYISGGYGSHVNQAGQQSAHYKPKKKLRKPRWRGNLALGLEKSFSGDYLNYDDAFGGPPPVDYNPAPFAESVTVLEADRRISTTYTSVVEEVLQPNISFDDVHSTPLTLSGGVEYIATPRTTLFANAGYTYAEGNEGDAITIIGRLERRTSEQQFDPATLANIGAPINNTTFIPNVPVAALSYDFSDLERYNLEAGARHYFNPILKGQTQRSITPFVGGAIGAAYYNAQSFSVGQSQLFLERAFESGGDTLDYYNVPDPASAVQVELYDSQWVPTGQLNAGLEWQMTPRTAMAFETGVRIEGARDYANGNKGDSNVTVPFTIRGSYNF